MKLLKLGILFSAAALFAMVPLSLPAQIGIGISISAHTAPPPLVTYEQPPCPDDGYLWIPGYWAWGDDGYYWVPGEWSEPPEAGLLWTPGYWGYDNDVYGWHDGYWGRTVGFYGGIDYGYGYPGDGFVGGMWNGDVFRYNTAVVNVNRTVVRNVYVDRTVVRNERVNHVSFNGRGGVMARPSARDEAAAHERHFQPTAMQSQRRTEARQDPQARFSANHGHPSTVAMARPGERPAARGNRPAEPGNARGSGVNRPENRPGARPAERSAAPREETPRGRPESRPEANRPAENPRNGAGPTTERSESPAINRETGRPEGSTRPANRSTAPAPRPTEHPAPRPAAPESRSARPMTDNRPAEPARPAPERRAAPAPRPESRPAARPAPESRPAEPRSESRPAPHPQSHPAARPAPESHPARGREQKPAGEKKPQ